MKNFIDQILTSSEDCTKISARVTGLLLSGSSFAMFSLAKFGFMLSDAQFTLIVTQIGTVAGAIWFLFGLGRYIVNKIGEKFLGWPKQ